MSRRLSTRRHKVSELSLLGREVDLAVKPALKPLILSGVPPKCA